MLSCTASIVCRVITWRQRMPHCELACTRMLRMHAAVVVYTGLCTTHSTAQSEHAIYASSA
jgi:hypothetical protein